MRRESSVAFELGAKIIIAITIVVFRHKIGLAILNKLRAIGLQMSEDIDQIRVGIGQEIPRKVSVEEKGTDPTKGSIKRLPVGSTSIIRCTI